MICFLLLLPTSYDEFNPRINYNSLKKKLIGSNKLVEDIKSTDPDVMKKEIERLCRPKVNLYIEREQFHKLKQSKGKKVI